MNIHTNPGWFPFLVPSLPRISTELPDYSMTTLCRDQPFMSWFLYALQNCPQRALLATAWLPLGFLLASSWLPLGFPSKPRQRRHPQEAFAVPRRFQESPQPRNQSLPRVDKLVAAAKAGMEMSHKLFRRSLEKKGISKTPQSGCVLVGGCPKITPEICGSATLGTVP